MHWFLRKYFIKLQRSEMFIERLVKTKISSVGAAYKPGTCRSYGACEFCQQISINMTLLRSYSGFEASVQVGS